MVLREFSLRQDSGGAGQYRGGDGVVRELEFMRPLSVSILSERRAFQPYGLHGGECGARGENYLIRREFGVGADGPIESEVSERVISLGGKNTVECNPGDRICILSPGGGGYGLVTDAATTESVGTATVLARTSGSVNQYQMNQETV